MEFLSRFYVGYGAHEIHRYLPHYQVQTEELTYQTGSSLAPGLIRIALYLMLAKILFGQQEHIAN